MTDVPKRIWAKPTQFSLKNAKATGGVWHTRPTITPSHTEYVPKDTSDELAEALKECWDAIDEPTGPMDRAKAVRNARAALAKYRETSK